MWDKMMTMKEMKMGHVGGRRLMTIVTRAIVLKRRGRAVSMVKATRSLERGGAQESRILCIV